MTDSAQRPWSVILGVARQFFRWYTLCNLCEPKMHRKIQVNFSALDPRGWVLPFEYHTSADLSSPLASQAIDAARWHLDSHNRCYRTQLSFTCVLSVFWCDDKGFWHAVEATDADGIGLEWGPNP